MNVTTLNYLTGVLTTLSVTAFAVVLLLVGFAGGRAVEYVRSRRALKLAGRAPGEPWRVFCKRHDLYAARYHAGRPLMEDRCPLCVLEDERGASVHPDVLGARPRQRQDAEELRKALQRDRRLN